MAAFIVLALVPSAAEARPVTAAWDRNTDLFTTGYRIFYGLARGVYTVEIEVGNVISRSLDLPPGPTYFFVVRAYNAAGQLGPASAEVAFTLPNSAPSVANPGDMAIAAGPVAGQLSAVDPDGDPLTYAVTGLPGTVVINPSNGAVSGYLLAGTYTVTAIASDGHLQGQQTFRVTATGSFCPGASAPPTLSVPTVSGSLVTASWTPPPAGAAAPPSTYVLHVGTAAGQSNYGIFELSAALTTASGAVPNGTYFLRAISRNACGDSGPSNEVSFRVGPPAPAAPTALSFQRQGNTVTLAWIAPASGTVTGYIIEAGSATGLANLATFPSGSTAPTVSAFAPSGTYFVRVRATNSGGPGPASNEIIVNVP